MFFLFKLDRPNELNISTELKLTKIMTFGITKRIKIPEFSFNINKGVSVI